MIETQPLQLKAQLTGLILPIMVKSPPVLPSVTFPRRLLAPSKISRQIAPVESPKPSVVPVQSVPELSVQSVPELSVQSVPEPFAQSVPEPSVESSGSIHESVIPPVSLPRKIIPILKAPVQVIPKILNNYLMYDGTSKSSYQLVVGDSLMGIDSLPKKIIKIEKVNSKIFQINPINSESFYVLPDDEVVMMATNMESFSWSDKEKKVSIKYLTSNGIKSKSFRTASLRITKDEALERAHKILDGECKKDPAYINYKDTSEVKAERVMTWDKRFRDCFKIFVQGVEFATRRVDLEPYALGHWLGDGTSSKAEITTADPEIIEYYKGYADRLGLMLSEKPEVYKYTLTSGTRFGGYGRNPFKQSLREYNLLDNKHIPYDYLYNDRQTRLAVLAGIIDSDGYMHYSGYDICFKSKKLADDTVFLARTLGFAVHDGAHKVKRTCTNGANGPVTGDYYRFYISGVGMDEIPCLIPHKKIGKDSRVTKKTATVSGFNIIDIGTKDYFKISIETPSRIFLQDMTVIKL